MVIDNLEDPNYSLTIGMKLARGDMNKQKSLYLEISE